MATESELINLKMQKAIFQEICNVYNSKDKKESKRIDKENKALLEHVEEVIKYQGRKYDQH